MKAEVWTNKEATNDNNYGNKQVRFNEAPAEQMPPRAPVDLGVCMVDLTTSLSRAQINSKHAESLALAQHSVMANMDGHEGTSAMASWPDRKSHLEHKALVIEAIRMTLKSRAKEDHTERLTHALSVALNNLEPTERGPVVDLACTHKRESFGTINEEQVKEFRVLKRLSDDPELLSRMAQLTDAILMRVQSDCVFEAHTGLSCNVNLLRADTERTSTGGMDLNTNNSSGSDSESDNEGPVQLDPTRQPQQPPPRGGK